MQIKRRQSEDMDLTSSDELDRDTPDGSQSPLPIMVEIHVAWLRAGASGDVASMRQLKKQFPEWLNLDRPVDATSTRRPRSCSWTEFHLQTIGASAIHTAACDGDTGILQFLLEAGQNPNTPGSDGVTPIMVAIMRFTLTTMRCMIRDGEVIKRNILFDCRKEEDELRNRVIAVIDTLLSFGADVNACTEEGKTALHLSTSDDAYEVAKHLLDVGANVDAQNENGQTALHCCVREADLLVTNLLLSRGANIDAKDADGQTPLTLAVHRGNLIVLQLFLNHYASVATLERQDFGGTLLLIAVEYGKEDVIRYIVDNDYAPVTVRNEKGETPMHRAIFRRNPALMELLLDLDRHGDNMVVATDSLATPAHYAARYGSHREIHTLLQCLTHSLGDLQELSELGGMNPLNVSDRHGKTSLYITGTEFNDPVDSLEVRDIKARLLMDHGAQLFSPGVLVYELERGIRDDSSHLILPERVKHCLQMWLVDPRVCTVEDDQQLEEEEGRTVFPVKALTKLCSRWIEFTVSGSSMTLAAIVTDVGYSHEVVPLLHKDIASVMHDYNNIDVPLKVQIFRVMYGSEDHFIVVFVA
ncbi:Ankyrin-3 [Phytophthora citrophthora]|uniref:Ankyrin-3 n=1 Tax=Phytophthora citrophthora TaxID=4793 RepID=A0AAD9GIG1_9STRA|nr:Ankyrin-3 [Phytophthora citrophthora]